MLAAQHLKVQSAFVSAACAIEPSLRASICYRQHISSVLTSVHFSRRTPRHSCVKMSSIPDSIETAESDEVKRTFFLDDFARRQWNDPHYGGTQISYDEEKFVQHVEAAHVNGKPLVDGYADFCKHVFVPNFIGARVGTVRITPSNEHLLKSGYSARTPAELPVLSRWFPAGQVEQPVAKVLDIIVYSREQLVMERAAQAKQQQQQTQDSDVLPDAPWGIISIKAQDEEFETPMQPITMLRNALGKEEGGSGVPLDRAKYLESVEYWKEHAVVLPS